MPNRSLLILTFSNIAADARLLKQIDTLSNDWEITTCSYGQQPAGTLHHYQIPDDKQYWRYDRTDLILHRYEHAYRFNPAVDAAWEMLSSKTFDAIFANELDMVPLAIRLKPRLGVHGDLHEYEPRLKDHLLRWRVFMRPFYNWIASKYLTKCKSVTAAWPKITEEYDRKLGIKADLVLNVTPHHQINPTPVHDPIKLVHAGSGQPERGIDALIDAVETTLTAVTLDLYLVPSNPSYLQQLKEKTQNSKRVNILPPVPYADLIRTLNQYDVGIHMMQPTSFNTKWALPNKVFDFIQGRLAVIVAPNPEMSRIVSEENIGEVTEDFSAESLCTVLDNLTAEQVHFWKENSVQAAENYQAITQNKVWADALERIANS